MARRSMMGSMFEMGIGLSLMSGMGNSNNNLGGTVMGLAGAGLVLDSIGGFESSKRSRRNTGLFDMW